MPLTRDFASAIGMAVICRTTPTGSLTQDCITIGAAGQTGGYDVFGQSLCQLVNRASNESGLKCMAPAMGGSIANLNGIRARDLHFGVVQSDWRFHALNGSSTFEEQGPNENLRSVLSAHADVVTILTRTVAYIATVQADCGDDLLRWGKNPGRFVQGPAEHDPKLRAFGHAGNVHRYKR